MELNLFIINRVLNMSHTISTFILLMVIIIGQNILEDNIRRFVNLFNLYT